MALLKKLSVLAVKAEATSGTAESLAGGDCVRVSDLTINPSDTAFADRSTISKNSFGALQNIYVGSLWEGSFTIELALAYDSTRKTEFPAGLQAIFGAAGVDPSAHPASGSRTGTIYNLKSTFKTLTAGFYENGERTLLKGCVVTALSLNLSAKESAKMTVSIKGILESRAAASITPSFPSQLPLVCKSATLTNTNLTSTALELDAITCDFGLQVAILSDLTAPDGFAPIRITDRQMTATINPVRQTFAQSDFFDKMTKDTVIDLRAQFTRGSDKILFKWEKCSITSYANSEKEGIFSSDLSLQCVSSDAGNDELSITTWR